MHPFTFRAATSVDHAVALASETPRVPHIEAPAQFLAGGTNLVDLMKLGVMNPALVIDINALSKDPRASRIEADAKGLRLGSLVRMSEAADHEAVRKDYPVIAETLLVAASSSLRNMASLGGNMLQRTRCPYFRDVSYTQCNKRQPGSGCAALDGFNRSHAVLGASENCIATYPGDFAQALIALDAVLEIQGSERSRVMRFADLHRKPGKAPDVETSLNAGELITAIHVPAATGTKRSVYVKVRDRESYEYALASAAVVLDLADGAVRGVRIALGGVATVPWRAVEAEVALTGKPVTEQTAQAAAEAAFAQASARNHNAYKIPLGKATLVRALLQAATMDV